MTISPRALDLCRRLGLDTRARQCGRTNRMSHRSPIRECTAPDCDCGPSGGLLVIEDWLRTQDVDMKPIETK
jgi:hypothetical protein